MIRFKLKVINKNENIIERVQDYTFEPEMFLQGLIKAFVLLDKRYYLMEYQNSPNNMLVEVTDDSYIKERADASYKAFYKVNKTGIDFEF